MADYTPRQDQGVVSTMRVRWKDMGDGTHALVGYVQSEEALELSASTSYTVTLTVADTEYGVQLPADFRMFEFQCRTNVDIRWSFTAGLVAAPTDPYRTLKAGAVYYSPIMRNGIDWIYFASDNAGVVVEVLVWS